MRASRSSGLRSALGERSPKPLGGVRPRLNGRGELLRRLKVKHWIKINRINFQRQIKSYFRFFVKNKNRFFKQFV